METTQRTGRDEDRRGGCLGDTEREDHGVGGGRNMKRDRKRDKYADSKTVEPKGTKLR